MPLPKHFIPKNSIVQPQAPFRPKKENYIADTDIRGKSSKHIRDVMIPNLQKLVKALRVGIRLRDRQLTQADVKYEKLERKLKMMVGVAKDSRKAIPVKLEFPNRYKKKKRLSIRNQKILKKNVITAAQTRDFAKQYHQDKVLANLSNKNPYIGLYTYPIFYEWMRHCGLKAPTVRLLIVISYYKWFVREDGLQWGLKNISPSITELETMGYIVNHKIKNRNTLTISEAGIEFIKTYFLYHNKQMELAIKNRPKKRGLPLPTMLLNQNIKFSQVWEQENNQEQSGS